MPTMAAAMKMPGQSLLPPMLLPHARLRDVRAMFVDGVRQRIDAFVESARRLQDRRPALVRMPGVGIGAGLDVPEVQS